MLGGVVLHERCLRTERFDERFGAVWGEDHGCWVLADDALYLWRGRLLLRHNIKLCLLGLIFVEEDVLLHLLQIDLVIEIDDVCSLASLLVNNALSVYFGHVFFALEKISILVDDRIESYLFKITNFCNGINRAHHQLIEVPIHKQLRLTA